MPDKERQAWKFECVLSNNIKINSWFYSDSKEDATKRIVEYLGAKLINLSQIDNPLKGIYNPKIK
jgi:hypothetical protein